MQILNVFEAEKAAPDVYKYVCKSASNCDPGRSNPAAWLVMLTRSRAIDKLRASNIPLKLPRTFEEELNPKQRGYRSIFTGSGRVKLQICRTSRPGL